MTSAGPVVRPTSVTSWWVSLSAAVAFVVTVWTVHGRGGGFSAVLLWGLAALVAVQLLLDVGVRRVHRREATGLVFGREQFRRNFSAGRSLVKLAGLGATLAVLAGIYLLLPMYRGPFHAPFWQLLRTLAPYIVALTIPYIFVVDALMAEPRDGYWHIAQLCGFRWRHVDWAIVREHAKSWAIKGFFLPLMVPYLGGALVSFVRATRTWTMVGVVEHVATFALCLDLAFVVIGYTLTLRILDSHIRSANPLVLGWIACLICYRPFWSFMGPDYMDGRSWDDWFEGSPALIVFWGLMVIAVKSGWAWSNILFGLRFSNLTHRGIITGGPYRFTKHPSYIFKNVGWWLINVPFLSAASLGHALWHSGALLAVNLIYFVRAMTEEIHLSEDPVYVAYAEWINEHGALRWLGRWIPALRYRAPRS